MPRSLSTSLTRKLGITLPIIQGPMNGGSTPEMVAAVSNAGAMGSLAAANFDVPTIHAKVAAIRALTSKPFCVNLFVLD
ncbi:nitronate monooxygenase, partial [Acinetobacter baumannii]